MMGGPEGERAAWGARWAPGDGGYLLSLQR